jgi:hypothetical protein
VVCGLVEECVLSSPLVFVYPPAQAGHMAKRRVGVECSPSILEPVRPGAVSPDRALCLPTFSHFVIVNKTSLSLTLSHTRCHARCLGPQRVCTQPVCSFELLPLACPLAPAPLPVGHADESVAQQLQMLSFQQGGTLWRPARKNVRRLVELHCLRPAPPPLILSPPIPSALSCNLASKLMEYPDFGQPTSSSSDNPESSESPNNSDFVGPPPPSALTHRRSTGVAQSVAHLLLGC